MTNTKDHNLNEIYTEISNLKAMRSKTFFDRYGAYIVALIVPLAIAFAGYITLGNQVATNTLDISSKANKEVVDIELRTIRNRHKYDFSNNTKAFEKLDNKLDGNTKLLQKILLKLPRPEDK